MSDMEKFFQGIPILLLTKLLTKKLSKRGFKLSDNELQNLAERVLKPNFQGTLDIKPLNISIKITSTDMAKINSALDNLLDSLDESFSKTLDKNARGIVSDLKRTWPKEYYLQEKELAAFRKRLQKRWGRGLQELRKLLTMAREMGGATLEKLSADTKSPKLLDVMLRLHTRSCQITDEIICLLSSGFADGAMGRWRTLHEISVVAQLMRKGGETLAARYLEHEIVETRKAALQYNEFCKHWGERPFNKKEIAKIEKGYARAIKKYGEDFDYPQGWASEYLKVKNPSFAQLQRDVGIEHFGPYYRMASHNVHANSKGVLFRLGFMREGPAIMAGASNAGLMEPASNAAVSLLQISSAFFLLKPDIENLLSLKVMEKTVKNIGMAFEKAQAKLIKDDQRYLQKIGSS